MKSYRPLMAILLLFIVTLPVWAQSPHIYFSVIGRKKITVVGRDIYQTGLYKSNSGLDQWQHLGWENISIFGIDVDPVSEGQRIFAAAGNGVLRSLDGGASWKIVTDWQLTECQTVVIDTTDVQTVYVTSSFGTWKSMDNGDSWTELTAGLSPTSLTFNSCLIIKPSDHDVLYLGTADGLLVSNDGGTTWDRLGMTGREIHDLQVAPYDENLMLCSTDEAGVYLSRDGGMVWRQINMGLKGRAIYSVAIDPNTPGTFYAGGFLCGVSKTTDYGRTWEGLDNEITDKTVRDLAIYPLDSNRIAAGVLNFGFYQSTDGGEHFDCAAECDGRVWAVEID